MLTSLFGDLGLSKQGTHAGDTTWQETRQDHERDTAAPVFAATAMLESTATSVNERGQLVDRHLRDLFVSGSPAQAMRAHFSGRADLEAAGQAITLYDPMRIWAPAVIKSLSDASGQPVERLQLRDRNSLRTLATIERTRVVRRFDETLKIYHAEDQGDAQIAAVLMERSYLAAVIVGTMHAASIEGMLGMLQRACREPSWICPNLLFIVPPSAGWIAERIGALQWPEGLRVSVLDQSLGSTSAVWNALLDVWNRSKSPPSWSLPMAEPGFPIRVAELGADTQPPADALPAVAARRSPRALDPLQAAATLQSMLQQEGLYGCALVDLSRGDADGEVLACESREGAGFDMVAATAAGTRLLRAHRQATAELGLTEPIDEVSISAGARQHVMRSLTRHPGVVMFAVFDSLRSNLGMVRYRILEAEKTLG